MESDGPAGHGAGAKSEMDWLTATESSKGKASARLITVRFLKFNSLSLRKACQSAGVIVNSIPTACQEETAREETAARIWSSFLI
jgi:hypothetical protein